jgi:CO/xanthine dehydrogenase FAD-binding subunit
METLTRGPAAPILGEVSGLEWYFPRDVSEVPALLARDGVFPHAGGTGILRAGLGRFRGLMDIARLGLDSVQRHGGETTVGAAASYASAARAIAAGEPGHIIAQSLSQAATTPLRNRITVGGSLALFPYWSDLAGPLIALGAEVDLLGGAGGTWPFVEYAARKDLRQASMVSGVRWKDAGGSAAYYRHTRTRVDHPAFTFTILVRFTDGSPRRISDARVVVVGCTGRYRRLSAAEKGLAGADPARVSLEEVSAADEVDFPARMGFSPEYLRHCARIQLRRTLARALGR